MPHLGKELAVSFLAIVTEACSREEVRAADWHIVSRLGDSKDWIHVHNNCAVIPQQGWKLHISANVWSAEEVLRRTLPIILAEDANFKVVSSIDALDELNSGNAGLSQI